MYVNILRKFRSMSSFKIYAHIPTAKPSNANNVAVSNNTEL